MQCAWSPENSHEIVDRFVATPKFGPLKLFAPLKAAIRSWSRKTAQPQRSRSGHVEQHFLGHDGIDIRARNRRKVSKCRWQVSKWQAMMKQPRAKSLGHFHEVVRTRKNYFPRGVCTQKFHPRLVTLDRRFPTLWPRVHDNAFTDKILVALGGSGEVRGGGGYFGDWIPKLKGVGRGSPGLPPRGQ